MLLHFASAISTAPHGDATSLGVYAPVLGVALVVVGMVALVALRRFRRH